MPAAYAGNLNRRISSMKPRKFKTYNTKEMCWLIDGAHLLERVRKSYTSRAAGHYYYPIFRALKLAEDALEAAKQTRPAKVETYGERAVPDTDWDDTKNRVAIALGAGYVVTADESSRKILIEEAE
jgi:hypothetical protein